MECHRASIFQIFSHNFHPIEHHCKNNSHDLPFFSLKTRVPKTRPFYKEFQPIPEYVHLYHFSAFRATIQERAWPRAMVPNPLRICNPDSIAEEFVRFKRT